MKLIKNLKKIGFYAVLALALINPIVLVTALILREHKKRKRVKT